MSVTEVAASTAVAAHRRDHRHALTEELCHPHTVAVIHLGGLALAICHDCGADSGFLPHRRAESLAVEHRQQTLVISVSLQTAPAA
ncbi:MAG: hypothetical protein ABJA81_09025 [Nocardioidaceae bacterium]